MLEQKPSLSVLITTMLICLILLERIKRTLLLWPKSIEKILYTEKLHSTCRKFTMNLQLVDRNIRVSSTPKERLEQQPDQHIRRPSTMVLKTELCRFSGAKIYPGRGIRFIRSDSQVFLFLNSKCKRYFHNRLKPSKLTWTAMYRKQHKKDVAAEAVKKRRRATKKPYSRSIVGATLEVIQKKRSEKPEVRDAAREAALREIKERIKKTKDEKKAKKAEVTAKSKSQTKGMPKGAGGKGPKLGGGGGKR